MGFLFSKKGSLISDYFMVMEDISVLKKGNATEISLFEDHLELSIPLQKPLTLNYSQITDIYYGLETEIVHKNKSVIGRAVAGGLLFGDVGAVVGAISGKGTKDKKERKFVFLISYKAASGEDGFLKFHDTRMYKGLKMSKMLKELCNIKDEPEEFSTQL